VKDIKQKLLCRALHVISVEILLTDAQLLAGHWQHRHSIQHVQLFLFICQRNYASTYLVQFLRYSKLSVVGDPIKISSRYLASEN